MAQWRLLPRTGQSLTPLTYSVIAAPPLITTATCVHRRSGMTAVESKPVVTVPVVAIRTCSRRSIGSIMSVGVISAACCALRKIVRYELVLSSSRYIQKLTVRSLLSKSGVRGTSIIRLPSNAAPNPDGPCPGPAGAATFAWLPRPLLSTPCESSNV
jgi:hypothetical protein